MSGFIGLLFGVLMTVTLTFMGIHWKDRKPRKRQVWMGLSGACGVAIIVSGAVYYLYPAPQAVSRPYVFVTDVGFRDAFSANAPIIFVNRMTNTGQVSAVGWISVFEWKYTEDLNQKSFVHTVEDRMKFEIAPNQKINGFGNTGFKVDEAAFKALKQGRARLFFFSRGEYTDESGEHTYPIRYCYTYDPLASSELALCSDDINVTYRDNER
jgi:hypothetical protein